MPEMLTRGVSVEYDIHGDGPSLLLIGGLGFGRWSWFKQVPALSDHFRTITFDIRGEQSLVHGVADLTAEVVTLLEHLGIERLTSWVPRSAASSPRNWRWRGRTWWIG